MDKQATEQYKININLIILISMHCFWKVIKFHFSHSLETRFKAEWQ